MNIELISNMISFLLGIYLLIQSIYLYKGKTVISYLSVNEQLIFINIIVFLMDQTMFRGDLQGLIIGLIPFILFGIYIVISRINFIKYRIYNSNKEDLYTAIIKTLTENRIQFTVSDDFIRVNDTSVYIQFIAKGFLIKKYKHLANYKSLLLTLEGNVKKIEGIKKKSEWLLEGIFGLFFIVMSAAWFIVHLN